MVNIPRDEWCSTDWVVEDDQGKLWRTIDFIDQPAVIPDPIIEPRALGEPDERHRHIDIIGGETSSRFHRLLPQDPRGR